MCPESVGYRLPKKKCGKSFFSSILDPAEMSSKDISLCLGKCLAKKDEGLLFFAEKQSLLTKFS